MNKAQCIVCKCGSVVAACVEPECYNLKELMADVRNYAKRGYNIEMREPPYFKMAECTCRENKLQLNLPI